MKKKLTKHDYKRILSPELFKNSKKGKRGTGGEMLKAVNTRLTDRSYIELLDISKMLGISRSNFVRYAVVKALKEINEQIEEYEEG